MLENATKNSSHLVVQKKKVKKGRKKKKPVVSGLFYRQYIAIKNNNLKDFEKYCTPMKHVFPDF
jgi:hypothetical protein